MRRLRHWLEYAAVVAVQALVRVLPRRVSRALGSAIGVAFYLCDGPHRRLAERNLRAAFPSRPSRECRRLARRAFAHFGRLLVELLYFAALAPEAMRRLVEIEGADRVEQAHACGRGVLFVTGHFGFWELHALAHGALLRPIGVLARPLDNPYLNRLLERMRSRTGNTVIYRRGALRRIFKELAQNRGVAVLIDQHIHSADRVWVEFFDRPAATTSAVAALALRTGAPVIPVFALPRADGRYRLIYEHPVEPPPPDEPDAVRVLTQRCTDVLEMYVRRYPELWLWMHRRWRDGEDGAAPVSGMFPAAREDERPAAR
jgi:KDO2-lipid IV(A) lauroyltransferase